MYMIYQQVATAIKNAYTGAPDVAQQAESARLCREWLESLRIEVDLRSALVEPIRALEAAFDDLDSASP